MVVERLRNFALRKRSAKASSSRLSDSSLSHSFIDEDSNSKSPLSGPSSIQSTNLAKQNINGDISQTFDVSTQTNTFPPQINNKSTQTENVASRTRDMSTQTDNVPSQTNDMSTQTDSMPSQTKDVSTQTEPDDFPQSGQVTDTKNEPSKEQANKRAWKKAVGPKHRRRLDSRLLALADTLVADNSAISRSGRAVSQRLNDTAREILEARTVMDRIDGETTQIASQVEMMKLKFDSAHLQFDHARDLHRSNFDHETEEDQEEEALAEMLHQVQVIEQMIEKAGGKNSKVGKTNQILSSLAELHKQNTSLYNFKVIEESISAIMKHFKNITIDPVYQHLRLVGIDAAELLEEIRKVDQDSSTAHKAILHKGKNKQTSDLKSNILKTKNGKEGLSESQVQLLEREFRADTITKVLSHQKKLMNWCASELIEGDCDSRSAKDVNKQKCTALSSAKECRCRVCQHDDTVCLKLFCDDLYLQLGDQFDKMVEEGALTTKQGATVSLKALKVALVVSKSGNKDVWAEARTLNEFGQPHGGILTEMDEVALAHLAACDDCKKARVVFLAKLENPA